MKRQIVASPPRRSPTRPSRKRRRNVTKATPTGTSSLADPNAQFDQIYYQPAASFQLSARYTF